MKTNFERFTFFCAIALTFNTASFSQTASLLAGSDTNCQGVTFVEKDQILVVEVESATPGSGWKGESLITGFTGASYFRWNGGDKFNTPGNGLTEYKIKINNPGTYHFRWHSKIMHGSKSTESNDSWLRIPDAADFFAKNDSSVKYPKGGMFIQSDSVTEGSSSDGWMKAYSSGTTSWTWSCRTSDRDPHEIYASFDTSGIYTVQISGRSENHAIDRFVLFVDTSYTVDEATNKILEETLCADAIATYVLTVNYGKGGGNYEQDSIVTIAANNATSNLVFDKWTGDTETITDIYEATTTLTIPNSNVTITATYKDEMSSRISETESATLKVFPNPASDVFYIDLPALSNPTLKIYSLSGNVVYQSNVNGTTFYVKNHGLPSGTYILHVLDMNYHATNLLVIQ